MKKITFILLAITWIVFFTILIIALTNIFPNNIFQNYKIVVGFAFLAITGFIRFIYQKLIKIE
jgi:hypothetical protein